MDATLAIEKHSCSYSKTADLRKPLKVFNCQPAKMVKLLVLKKVFTPADGKELNTIFCRPPHHLN
jgi:hypothetical protein